MGITLSCFVLEALATPPHTGSTVQQYRCRGTVPSGNTPSQGAQKPARLDNPPRAVIECPAQDSTSPFAPTRFAVHAHQAWDDQGLGIRRSGVFRALPSQLRQKGSPPPHSVEALPYSEMLGSPLQ